MSRAGTSHAPTAPRSTETRVAASNASALGVRSIEGRGGECLEACDRGEIRSVILRFTSLYGPGLRKQVLWDLCQKLAVGAGEVSLSGTGDETRDLLHGRDAAAAVVVAYDQAFTRSVPLIFNAGSGSAWTIRDIARVVIDVWAVPAKVRFDGVLPSDNPPPHANGHQRADGGRLCPANPVRRWCPRLR
ncbi:MAG: NAD-dependent epimerase/dehydratase family protein [Candidatus Rokuibacteriota bacterium]